MKYIYLPILLLFSLTSLYSQPENFTSNYDNYNCFAFDDDNYYVGLVNGFVVQDRETGDYEYYSTLNSDMVGNNVSGIEVYKGKTYFLSDSLIYVYNNKEVSHFGVKDSKVTVLKKSENDFLWISGNDFLIRFDGENFKEINISTLVEEYRELNSYATDGDFIWLTFRPRNSDVRYAIYNLSNDSIKTFTYEERGFGEEFGTIMNFTDSVVWIRSGNEIYSYMIENNEWRTNINFRSPVGIDFNSNFTADKNGIIWFIVRDRENNYLKYLASTDVKSDSIKIHYQYTFERDYNYFLFSRLGDEIVLKNDDSFYFLIGDELIEIYTPKSDYKLEKASNFYINGEDIQFLALIDKNGESNFEFRNPKSDESVSYNISWNSDLPYYNIGSYIVVGGHEFLSKNYNSISLVRTNESWLNLSTLGYTFSYYNSVDFDEDGDLYIYSDAMFRFDESGVSKLFDYDAFWYRFFNYHNDKLYFYGVDKIGNHYHPYNYNKINALRVDIYSTNGTEEFSLNEENTCMPRYFERGLHDVIHGSYPNDLEIDNEGRVWCLTWTSIYKINENLNCTYFEFDEEDEEVDNPLPNQIAYSRYQGKMYGRHDNIVYSFGDTNYRKVSSEDIVDGELNFIGESNDGLVYVATTDGRLFKLNTIDSWERIPLIEGKEKIHANIRNVFRSEDTLYVSTEIGLIKVHQKITSVENSTTEELDVNVFPNPVGNTFNLTDFEGEAVIYNSFGAKVRNINIGSNNINVSELPTGIYFITDSNGNPIAKFAKE